MSSGITTAVTQLSTEEPHQPDSPGRTRRIEAGGLARSAELYRPFSRRLRRRPRAFTALDFVLFLGLFFAQVADIVTTNIGLERGVIWEANPLIAAAQAYLGAPWWLPKLMVGTGVAIVMLWSPIPRPWVALAVVISWVPPALNFLSIMASG